MSNQNGVYVARTGTPNSMGGKMTKRGDVAPLSTGTMGSVKTSVKRHLANMKSQADKFDRAAAQRITSIAEELNSLHDGSMHVGEVRSWQWEHISITSRIEIERKS